MIWDSHTLRSRSDILPGVEKSLRRLVDGAMKRVVTPKPKLRRRKRRTRRRRSQRRAHQRLPTRMMNSVTMSLVSLRRRKNKGPLFSVRRRLALQRFRTYLILCEQTVSQTRSRPQRTRKRRSGRRSSRRRRWISQYLISSRLMLLPLRQRHLLMTFWEWRSRLLPQRHPRPFLRCSNFNPNSTHRSRFRTFAAV